MKKLFIYSIIALVALILTSCMDGDKYNMLTSSAFVVEYYDCESIAIYGGNELNSRSIGICTANISKNSGILSKRDAKKRYNSLCSKHGDTSYNKDVVFGFDEGCQHLALSYDFASLDITCDRALDNLHPANSSINDLVSCTYKSCKPYIDSGYNDSILPEKDPHNNNYGWTSNTKLVSELRPDDLTLLRYTELMQLQISDEVAIPDKSTITITLTTDEGKKFSVVGIWNEPKK